MEKILKSSFILWVSAFTCAVIYAGIGTGANAHIINNTVRVSYSNGSTLILPGTSGSMDTSYNAIQVTTGLAGFRDPLSKMATPAGNLTARSLVTYTNTFGNAGTADILTSLISVPWGSSIG